MSVLFKDTWDTAYEMVPADSENINLGANRIRDLKTAARERLVVDHSWAGDTNDGKHSQVTLRPRSGSLPLDISDAALWSQAVSANQELFFQDSSGRLVQMTAMGVVNTPPSFPTGTRMLFLQGAAPLGWVQDVVFSDLMVRVVADNSGGAIGGNWAISGLQGSTTVLGHQLTVGELPSHTHSANNVLTNIGGVLNFGNASAFIQLTITQLTTDGGTGGNQAHSHAAATTVAGDGTWRPAYVNSIVCTKGT